MTPDERAAAQAKHGLKPDRRYFMYSGRLAPVKRVDTLLDAFVAIAERRPEWDVVIAGNGPLEQELRARIPAELAHRVIWTGFVGTHAELAALYTCVDLFVLPSTHEPWAVVVCEAAAAGVPMAVSNIVGAAAEICRDGVNGRVFPPRDASLLATILLELTEDEDRLREMGRASLRLLDDWRRRGDPIQGVRAALHHAGLIGAPTADYQPTPATPLTAPGRPAPPTEYEAPGRRTTGAAFNTP
jgi:glycosyltransferase involved in cell wall biosynthesis